jgi:hypothetical protein
MSSLAMIPITKPKMIQPIIVMESSFFAAQGLVSTTSLGVFMQGPFQPAAAGVAVGPDLAQKLQNRVAREVKYESELGSYCGFIVVRDAGLGWRCHTRRGRFRDIVGQLRRIFGRTGARPNRPIGIFRSIST